MGPFTRELNKMPLEVIRKSRCQKSRSLELQGQYLSGAALKPCARLPPQEPIISAPMHERGCARCALHEPLRICIESCMWVLQVKNQHKQNYLPVLCLHLMSTGQSSNCGDVNHHGGDYVLACTFFLPLPSMYSCLLMPQSLTSPFMRFHSLPSLSHPTPSLWPAFSFFLRPEQNTVLGFITMQPKQKQKNPAQTPPLFSLLIFLLSLVNTNSHFSWSPFCNA